MLDTCAINHIIEDKSKLSAVLNKNLNFFITYIQLDELDEMKVTWADKYSEAVRFLNMIQVKEEPSSVTVVSYWRLGKTKSGNGESYNHVLEYMKRKRKKNHIHDAIIADSAIEYKMTLVTDDHLLTDAINSFGGKVITLDDFIKVVLTIK
jgi:rRNA-processing protein FCF1